MNQEPVTEHTQAPAEPKSGEIFYGQHWRVMSTLALGAVFYGIAVLIVSGSSDYLGFPTGGIFAPVVAFFSSVVPFIGILLLSSFLRFFVFRHRMGRTIFFITYFGVGVFVYTFVLSYFEAIPYFLLNPLDALRVFGLPVLFIFAIITFVLWILFYLLMRQLTGKRRINGIRALLILLPFLTLALLLPLSIFVEGGQF